MMLGDTYLTEAELAQAGFRALGKNVKVHRRASVYGTENVSLGDDTRIDDFCVIVATGPLEVGKHVSIPNFCFLGTRYGVVLEDFVTLAPGVQLFTASDDYSGQRLTGPTLPRQYTGGKAGPIRLRKHVIIGAGSVVLPGCTIGEGSSVGALSMVVRDLEPWGVYAGVPVSRLKDRRKDLLALERHFLSSQGSGGSTDD